MSPIDLLNALSDEDAGKAFEAVCGSKKWVAMMRRARPFDTLDDLQDAGQAAWQALDPADWLEAFAAHPRIGRRQSSHENDTRGWARTEQNGMDGAPDSLRSRLAELNEQYEDRFGYIFIVCATGRAADDMLKELETRLTHSPERELPVAAAEQAKIIRLRIEKLCQP